LGARATGRI